MCCSEILCIRFNKCINEVMFRRWPVSRQQDDLAAGVTLLQLLESRADAIQLERRGDRYFQSPEATSPASSARTAAFFARSLLSDFTPYCFAAAKSIIVLMRPRATPTSIASFTALSNYHSLQLSLEKRFSAGLSGLAS